MVHGRGRRPGQLFGAGRRLVVLLVAGAVSATGAVAATGAGSAAAATPPAPETAALAAVAPGPNRVVGFGTADAVDPAVAAPASPFAAVASTPDGLGYWAVTRAGRTVASGDARVEPRSGRRPLVGPIVGIAATPDGGGYWLLAASGATYAYGDAPGLAPRGSGAVGGRAVGIATTGPRGFLVAFTSGRVMAFGTARWRPSVPAASGVVGIAATPDGGGYWLVTSSGAVSRAGDARGHGGIDRPLDAPVVGIAAAPDGGGYWLVGADGGVFAFGDAPFRGSVAGRTTAPAVGIAARAGGYWVALGRSTSPVPAITAYLRGRIDDVTVAVDDLRTGQIYAYRPGYVEHTASTVKVDILATLLRQAQAEDRTLTPSEQALAVPMIEDSLDRAADALWVRLGPGAVGSTEAAVGMHDTFPATDGIWGTTTTTAEDRLAMLRALVEPNRVLDPASRAYVLGLMEHVTPSQDWGASGGVAAGATVALKNGFSIIDGWQINTTGWVHGDGRDYLVAVLSQGNPTEAYGIDTVTHVSALVWGALGA